MRAMLDPVALVRCPQGVKGCPCVRPRDDGGMTRTPTSKTAEKKREEAQATALEAVRLTHARLQQIESLRTQASRDRAVAMWHAHRLGMTYQQIAEAVQLGRPTVIALVQRGEAEVVEEQDL